jgi:hypothetical protein
MSKKIWNYKEVIKEFRDTKYRLYLSDKYLKDNGCITIEEESIAIEFPYGIVYLQDTAVEVLIKRIKELEEKLKEHGCGMTITSEPEPEHATEGLTEDEREALREVVRDYAYYVRNAGVGLILEPDVMRNRVELAEQAVRKILGDEFGAQTKKEP